MYKLLTEEVEVCICLRAGSCDLSHTHTYPHTQSAEYIVFWYASIAKQPFNTAKLIYSLLSISVAFICSVAYFADYHALKNTRAMFLYSYHLYRQTSEEKRSQIVILVKRKLIFRNCLKAFSSFFDWLTQKWFDAGGLNTDSRGYPSSWLAKAYVKIPN